MIKELYWKLTSLFYIFLILFDRIVIKLIFSNNNYKIITVTYSSIPVIIIFFNGLIISHVS